MDNNTLVDVLVFLKLILGEILEFCPTTLNKNLVISKFLVTIRMFVSFPLEPLGLKCEMTVMPFEWVLGRDT